MIRGYDIDGVITDGVRPFGVRSFIITGRSYEQSEKTLDYLYSLRVYNTVYFCPLMGKEITREVAGQWKADMIKLLKVSEFYEDDEIQLAIILKENPGIKVHHVVNGRVFRSYPQ